MSSHAPHSLTIVKKHKKASPYNKYMKILNHRGMSIIQVLLGSALVAGVALVLAQLGVDSSKVQRSAAINAEIVQFNNMVEKLLLNNDACVNTFNRPGFNPAFIEGSGQININTIQDFHDPPVGGNSVYDITKDVSGNLIITSMFAQRGGGSNPWSQTNELRLFIELGRKNEENEDDQRRTLGARRIIKTYAINAEFDSNDRVTNCYSDLDDIVDSVLEELCLDFEGAGAWVPGAGDNLGNCTVDTSITHQTFTASGNMGGWMGTSLYKLGLLCSHGNWW